MYMYLYTVCLCTRTCTSLYVHSSGIHLIRRMTMKPLQNILTSSCCGIGVVTSLISVYVGWMTCHSWVGPLTCHGNWNSPKYTVIFLSQPLTKYLNTVHVLTLPYWQDPTARRTACVPVQLRSIFIAWKNLDKNFLHVCNPNMHQIEATVISRVNSTCKS